MYKITIEQFTSRPEGGYTNREELYVQQIESLNLQKVIKAINEME